MNQLAKIKTMCFLTAALCCSGWSPALAIEKAHINNYVIKHYSIEQGLSQSTVFSILQDSQGYMWFGTRGGGLNRFNGYEFRVFRSKPNDTRSLSCNEIISMHEDSSGQLWIGTRFGGVNVYNIDNETIERLTIFPDKPNNFSVFSFVEDKGRFLWIGTDEGLVKYNFKEQSFHEIYTEGIAGNEISSLILDTDGNLIIGSRKGVYAYNTRSNTVELLARIKSETTDQIEQSNIPLLLDSRQTLWFGTPYGVFHIPAGESKEIIENPLNIPLLKSKQIRTIREDKYGNIWFGLKGGLLRYNPMEDNYLFFEQREDPQLSLGHNSVHSFYEDINGNIWVGTWGGGITFLSHLPRKFSHFRYIPFQNSLSDNTVSAFAENQHGLWIGTENGGLNHYHYQTGIFRTFRAENNIGLTSNHIKCLFTDNSNRLWVGSWGNGIFLFDEERQVFRNYLTSTTVYSIKQDKENNLWIGTINGLYRFDIQEKKISGHYQLEEHLVHTEGIFVTYLFNDSKNNLWVGTKQHGLFLYNRIKNSFIAYAHNENDTTSLINNYVICMNEDSEGNLWIGTNSGLCQYNYSSNNFSRFDDNLTMPDNVINGIVPGEHGMLWISTNKGISMIDPVNKEFRNFDIRDGLQSNEFTRAAYFKSKTGQIYFGGINGFNAFDPQNIQLNTVAPDIIFTGLKIFNQTVIPGDDHHVLENHISRSKGISLNYKQSLFEIEFVAINYLMPSGSQYRYRLEGYNDLWTDIGTDRKVSFMNLKDGSYTLHVMASNEDGIWNKEGASLQINILPPPWKTNEALVVYFIALVLISINFRRMIIARYERKNLILNEKLEKERMEELNQMKLRFFTNITHEFKTPLTLISAPLDSLMAENLLEKRKYYYSLIKSNTDRLKRLVEQLMDFRKAEHDKYKLRVKEMDMKNFITQITESFSNYAIKKDISFHIDCRCAQESRQWFDPGIIDKIIFNLLSNAFKFTGAKGMVELIISVVDGMCLITVKDNGKGISEDKLPQIFDRFYSGENPQDTYISGTGIGLSFSRRLAEIHKGTLDAQSTLGVGSEFTLEFPVRMEDYSTEEIIDNSQPNPDSHPTSHHEKEDIISPKQSVVLSSVEEKDKSSILIVENDEEMLQYLESHFSGKYRVFLAENGEEGLKLVRDKIPDLVITDIIMPEMDGFKFCEAIKNGFSTSHIPVIIMTARTNPENSTEGMNRGADIYIQKPFEIDYLESVVANLINQRQKLRNRFSLDNTSISMHGASDDSTEFMTLVSSLITDKMADPAFSIEELCDRLHISRSQLFRKFKHYGGISPSDFIRVTRLKKSAELLLSSNLSVKEIAGETGFINTSHFIAAFKKYFGETPKEYVKNRQQAF
jgi:ligand-binding sensor domain-containing protein/signal transduction histidine kinase/AraC-like DNA-binding protein